MSFLEGIEPERDEQRPINLTEKLFIVPHETLSGLKRTPSAQMVLEQATGLTMTIPHNTVRKESQMLGRSFLSNTLLGTY